MRVVLRGIVCGRRSDSTTYRTRIGGQKTKIHPLFSLSGLPMSHSAKLWLWQRGIASGCKGFCKLCPKNWPHRKKNTKSLLTGYGVYGNMVLQFHTTPKHPDRWKRSTGDRGRPPRNEARPTYGQDATAVSLKRAHSNGANGTAARTPPHPTHCTLTTE